MAQTHVSSIGLLIVSPELPIATRESSQLALILVAFNNLGPVKAGALVRTQSLWITHHGEPSFLPVKLLIFFLPGTLNSMDFSKRVSHPGQPNFVGSEFSLGPPYRLLPTKHGLERSPRLSVECSQRLTK